MSPLRHPVYRRLFTAHVATLLGTGLTTVGLALLAYDIAGDRAGVILGTALAVKMVAYVTVAPVTGALAHRLPRRGLLVGLNLMRAATVVGLPFIDAVWQIYALIVLLNAGAAAFTPTLQATIPDVLPDEATYTRALSLSRIAHDLESLVSPLLAAALLLVMTYNGLFMGTAAGFLASAGLVVSLTLPASSARRVGGAFDQLTHGIRTYLASPRLRGLMALNMAVAASGAMIIVNTVVYVRGPLDGGETWVALAFAASGMGSITAALILPRILNRITDRSVMLAGAVVMGVGLLMGLARPGFAALLFLWAVLGLGSSMIQTPAGRLVVRSAPAGDRPAVFAAQFALSHACWLVTYPVAGWLGAEAGLDAAFAVLGVTVLAVALGARQLWPARVAEEDHGLPRP